MVGQVLAFHKLAPIDLIRLEGPSEPNFVCVAHPLADLLVPSLVKQLSDGLVIVSLGHGVALTLPFMLAAKGFADTVEPGLQRSVVVLDAVIAG